MRLHIVETGEPPAPLKSRYGDYRTMFERVISQHAPGVAFTSTAIYEGDALPGPSDYDGVIITGSPAGVYEGHDWIAPAEEFVRRAADAGKPQIGICFGHQLMAQAFGGVVEKSDKGWGVGVHQYDVFQTRPWMTQTTQKIRCTVSHQDQVIEAPKGALTLAGSEFCPLGALSYAQGPAISFQMHPEFDHAFAEALMRLRKDRIPGETVSEGISSLTGRTDRDLISQWMASFLMNGEG
ncbi:MAG: type 1 glutamine amidotransferase [Pseudomonadota bacterium]